MFKVRIEKQNDKEVEFVKEVEFQSVPEERQTIDIAGKQYVVKSIRQSPECYIVTVKDKSEGGFKGLQYL